LKLLPPEISFLTIPNFSIEGFGGSGCKGGKGSFGSRLQNSDKTCLNVSKSRYGLDTSKSSTFRITKPNLSKSSTKKEEKNPPPHTFPFRSFSNRSSHNLVKRPPWQDHEKKETNNNSTSPPYRHRPRQERHFKRVSQQATFNQHSSNLCFFFFFSFAFLEQTRNLSLKQTFVLTQQFKPTIDKFQEHSPNHCKRSVQHDTSTLYQLAHVQVRRQRLSS
jgi:hypothetical protein